jgi:hypothetical protein
MGYSSIAARPRTSTRPSTLPAVRLALVLAGVLVPIVTVELLLRTFGPILPGNYDTGAYLTRHPTYGHYHPPNYSGWIRREEYLVHVQTNAVGQRGREMPLDKPPGVFRVLVLGDSFVEAIQVAEHERFIARLQATFDTIKGQRFEVIDGGCGGWGTAQEYLYLRDDGMRYAPDLVILAFFVGNDVPNNSLALELDGRAELTLKPYFRPNEHGWLELVEPRVAAPTPPEQLAFSLRERSVLYNVAETGVFQKLSLDDQWARWRDLDAVVELRRQQEDELFRPTGSEGWEEAWGITDRLIGMVKGQASAHGSDFALVAIPTRTQVVESEWRELAGRDRGRRAGLERYLPSKRLGRSDRGPVPRSAARVPSRPEPGRRRPALLPQRPALDRRGPRPGRRRRLRLPAVDPPTQPARPLE